jgi:hypothetical protein
LARRISRMRSSSSMSSSWSSSRDKAASVIDWMARSLASIEVGSTCAVISMPPERTTCAARKRTTAPKAVTPAADLNHRARDRSRQQRGRPPASGGTRSLNPNGLASRPTRDGRFSRWLR